MKLISRLQLILITIFTVVETVVLTLWLYLLGVPASVMLANGGIAAIVLFVGLFLEHSIAIAAGDFPPQGAVQPQVDTPTVEVTHQHQWSQHLEDAHGDTKAANPEAEAST